MEYEDCGVNYAKQSCNVATYGKSYKTFWSYNVKICLTLVKILREYADRGVNYDKKFYNTPPVNKIINFFI
jgi:hypothetical protein